MPAQISMGQTTQMCIRDRQYAEQMQSYDGKMATIGIGTVIDASGYIKIIEVYPDSAAETSGLKVGDLIVKVEDLDVTAETAEQDVYKRQSHCLSAHRASGWRPAPTTRMNWTI